MPHRRLLVLCALVACGQDKIEVRRTASTDYHHTDLIAAVDAFVTAGRTAPAYAALSRRVLELRPGMDRSVARDAELRLLVLALGPVDAVHARPIDDQVGALGLTVWPTLLAPAIEVDQLLTVHDPRAAELQPKPGEDAAAYLTRLCEHPLASDCRRVVPELQAGIIAAVATRRATERVRNAVAECVMCGADPGWAQAVRTWEALDHAAAGTVADLSHRGDPGNWPAAGEAAEPPAALPEAEISETGEVVIAGQRYGATQRVGALRDLRGANPVLALHLRPETSLAQVRGVLADARQAGATRVAAIAREPRYPWARKLYWIADGVGPRAGLRPTDSLQLLLHAVDVTARPGTVARVD
jgi:hypothetical protein